MMEERKTANYHYTGNHSNDINSLLIGYRNKKNTFKAHKMKKTIELNESKENEISAAFSSLSTELQNQLNSITIEKDCEVLKNAIETICRRIIPRFSFLRYSVKNKARFDLYPFNFVLCRNSDGSMLGETTLNKNYDIFMRLMFIVHNEIFTSKIKERNKNGRDRREILDNMINKILDKVDETTLLTYSIKIEEMINQGNNFLNIYAHPDDLIYEFTRLNTIFKVIDEKIASHSEALEAKNKEMKSTANNNESRKLIF